MTQSRSLLARIGWETLLGTAVLLSIFACGVILPYVMTEGDTANRSDSYCTPGIAGQSVRTGSGEGGEEPAQDRSEENLFGSEPATDAAPHTAEACSRNYIFGTDVSGRDIFYYVMTTSTAYIVPSIIVMAISIVLGSFFGVMAGYYGAHVAGEGVSMISNSISVYPPLLFVLLLTRILDNPSIAVIAAVFAVTESARLGFMVMNKIQVLREEEFIAAAKEMGLSDWKIITKHVLWYNCREVLLVHGIFSVAGFVMIELYLGYLNAGNFGAWGAIIGPGARDFSEHWWLLILPATVVILTIFSFYLIGDGLVKYFGGQLSESPAEPGGEKA